MKSCNFPSILKKHKVVGVMLGILLAVVLLGVLASTFAWLLMLLWNVVVVAALLEIANSITFLTALKGVAILYGLLSFAQIIRSVVHGYMQNVQMQVAMKMMRQFDDDMKNAQVGKKDNDILRYFRTN